MKLLKINSWITTKPEKNEIFFLTVFFAFGSANVARIYISWDGYLYLASAKALFRPEFYTNYHWVREPLYPLLLRFTHIVLGSSDIGFALLNSSILGLSIYFLLTKLSLQRYKIYLIYIFIFGNTLTIGFIGSILTQVLIGANLVAFFTIGIIFYTNLHEKLLISDKAYIIAVSVLTALHTFTLYPIFCVIYIFAFVIQMYKRTYLKDIKVIMMSLIIFLGTSLTWQAYKNENSQLTFGIYEPKFNLNSYDSSFRDPLIKKNAIFTGLLGLTGDVDGIGNFKSEIRTFGLGSEDPNVEICGFFNVGKPNVVEYVSNYVTNSCKPAIFYKFLHYNHNSSLFIYHATVLILLFANVLLLFKSRVLLILTNSISWLLFSGYYFFGMGISRYLFPLYFLGIIVIFSKNEIIDTIQQHN